jgi:hypothetical protein
MQYRGGGVSHLGTCQCNKILLADEHAPPETLDAVEHPNEQGEDQGSDSNSEACYGRLAVVSDVDDGGFCPECRQESCGDLPCYIEASTTERCWDRGGRDAHLE